MDGPQLARNQLLVPATLDTALDRWLRLEEVDELQLKKGFCLLMSTLLAKSTNDLRSFNGSSTWLLYFGNPASSRVQMIYEASRGQALAVCTLAFSALLHGANTGRMPVCTSANPNLQGTVHENLLTKFKC